jgi:hypothetical protein
VRRTLPSSWLGRIPPLTPTLPVPPNSLPPPPPRQVAVIEFARNVLGLTDADSTEFNAATAHPAVVFMPEISTQHMVGARATVSCWGLVFLGRQALSRGGGGRPGATAGAAARAHAGAPPPLPPPRHPCRAARCAWARAARCCRP